jgi:hypothetical protein
MEEIASASLNTFGISPKADFVLPSEESVFILTSGQLQDIIKGAIQPLQDEISDLKATVAHLQKDLTALEATQETQADNQLIQLRLINDLRESKKVPGKTEISRADKIERYLVSRPDHKASFETLKGYLQVDNVRLNEAIKILMATSDHSYSIQKEKAGDKRKRVLIMLPR